MLVASTAMSLIAPIAAQASDTVNLEEMNNYSRSNSKVQRFDSKTFINEVSEDIANLKGRVDGLETKQNEFENFINYLSNPSKQTFLMFAFKNKVLDKRKKLTKKIIESCVVLNTEDKENKIYDNQLAEWVKNEVKENKFSIDEKATILLIENIGNNLNKLENELQKVYLNKKDNEIINSKDIEMYVGINRDYNLFELQDSLVNKDLSKAIKIVSYFESNPKNNPLQKTILFLFNFFSKLLFVMSHKMY